MARHPDQLVTNARLSIKEASHGSFYKHDFFLQMKMRGRDGALTAEGSCKRDGLRYHCFVECDGGGIDVVARSGYVMMYLDRIRMAPCDGKAVTGKRPPPRGRARGLRYSLA
jgi:hypothetical protein